MFSDVYTEEDAEGDEAARGPGTDLQIGSGSGCGDDRGPCAVLPGQRVWHWCRTQKSCRQLHPGLHQQSRRQALLPFIGVESTARFSLALCRRLLRARRANLRCRPRQPRPSSNRPSITPPASRTAPPGVGLVDLPQAGRPRHLFGLAAGERPLPHVLFWPSTLMFSGLSFDELHRT